MTSNHIDFHRINEAALRHARSLLPVILPGGKFRSLEYTAINPTRADKTPGSFSVNYKSGVWKDFATEEGGGDLVSLLAYLQGTSQGEAAHALADMLAVAPSKQSKSSYQNGIHTPQREGGTANGVDVPKIYPGGEEGPCRFAREVRRHIYRDESGLTARIKVKFESGKYANLYRVNGGGSSAAWQPKKPSRYVPVPYITRSLDPFDAELIADHLLWPEGEKDVDTLDQANMPAFSFGGVGDGLADDIRTVISERVLLSNRHVVILADNDEAGRIHAEKKARFAHSAGAASIKIVHFPELPEKGDVSDYFAAGGTAETLVTLIGDAEQRRPAATDSDVLKERQDPMTYASKKNRMSL
jgi:putative DNA primase/helicase